MTKKKINLDEYEKEILEDFEKGKFVSVPNLDKEMQWARQAASNFMKKNARVNIRISTADLDMIRRIAVQEGLSYQVLLASVVHKFAAGRLVDKTVNK